MSVVNTVYQISAKVSGTQAVKELIREIDRAATGTDRVRAALARSIPIAASMATALTPVAGAALLMTVRAANLADDMNDLSARTGVAIETLSRYQLAAQANGTTLDSVASSINKLNKNLVESRDGTGAAAAAFKAMGIDVLDSEGKLKSAEAVIDEVADRFKDFPDGPQKAALAMAVFGKSGADMIPMLNEGAEGLSRVKVIITEEFAAASKLFNDKTDLMRGSVQQLSISMAEGLLPTLNGAADAMLDLFGGDTQSEAQTFGRVVGSVIKGVAISLATLVMGAKNAVAVIQSVGTAGYGVDLLLTPGRGNDGMELLKGAGSGLSADLAKNKADLENFIGLLNGEGSGKGPLRLTVGRTPSDITKSMEAFAGGADKAGKAAKTAAEELKELQDKFMQSMGNRDALFGEAAQIELLDYAKSIGSVGQSLGQTLVGAFKGAEDALVEFTRTGKLNFKSLASSIIEDLIRMQIQQSITGPLSNMLGGLFGSIGQNSLMQSASAAGGPLSWITGGINSTVRGFATGGAFTVGGSAGTDTNLVAFRATRGERVSVETPGQQRSGGSGVSVVVNVNAEGSQVEGNKGAATALGNMIAGAVRDQLIKAKLPGGVLYT